MLSVSEDKTPSRRSTRTMYVSVGKTTQSVRLKFLCPTMRRKLMNGPTVIAKTGRKFSLAFAGKPNVNGRRNRLSRQSRIQRLCDYPYPLNHWAENTRRAPRQRTSIPCSSGDAQKDYVDYLLTFCTVQGRQGIRRDRKGKRWTILKRIGDFKSGDGERAPAATAAYTE